MCSHACNSQLTRNATTHPSPSRALVECVSTLIVHEYTVHYTAVILHHLLDHYTRSGVSNGFVLFEPRCWCNTTSGHAVLVKLHRPVVSGCSVWMHNKASKMNEKLVHGETQKQRYATYFRPNVCYVHPYYNGMGMMSWWGVIGYIL